MVAKLLQLGADPNLGDREHVTPLIGAANTGRRDICEFCLEADADVDLVDKWEAFSISQWKLFDSVIYFDR